MNDLSSLGKLKFKLTEAIKTRWHLDITETNNHNRHITQNARLLIDDFLTIKVPKCDIVVPEDVKYVSLTRWPDLEQL